MVMSPLMPEKQSKYSVFIVSNVNIAVHATGPSRTPQRRASLDHSGAVEYRAAGSHSEPDTESRVRRARDADYVRTRASIEEGASGASRRISGKGRQD